MPHPSKKLAALLLAALAATLGACSSSSAPGSTSNAIDQVQANDLSSDVASDLDDMIDFSNFNATTGVALQASGARTQGFFSPGCVTITPVPLVNSDGDAVPDSARFDYAGCAYSRWNGTVTDSLSGTIDFIDPQPLVASLGVRHVFTNFRHKRINTLFPLRSFIALQSGTREWGGNADTLGHTVTNFVTVWTHPSGRVSTHTKDWLAKFTATTPGSISLITPLPAGQLTVGGTGTWATLNRSWSVVTSTATPLAYDPTCTVAPRFTAGEVDLVVTRNTEVVDVSVVFTACGQYTVTRTPRV